MDPVKELFDRLPPPQYLEDDCRSLGTWKGGPDSTLHTCLAHFLKQCRNIKNSGGTFVDADTEFLFEGISAFHELAGLSNIGFGLDEHFVVLLAELALKDGRSPRDITSNSRKAECLRYSAWLKRGRRYSEDPFVNNASDSNIANSSLSLEHFANLTTETAKQAQNKCAHCGNTGGELVRCTGCLLDEDWGYLAVSYCGKDCQKQHWTKAHRTVCRDRRRIANAAALTRSLSEQFQARTFDMSYAKIEVEDGSIKLLEFAEADHLPLVAMIPEAFKGAFIFREPPQQVRGHDSPDSEDSDKAIIHYNRCMEHSTVEWPFLGMFLEPISKSITEMSLMPKNIPLVTSHYAPSGGYVMNTVDTEHQVLCIALNSGEKFVLDLSAAQYGWHERLSAVHDFLTTRSMKIKSTGAPGYQHGREDQMRMMTPTDCIERMGHNLKEEVAATMEGKMRIFLQLEKLTVVQLLDLKKTEFDNRLQQLLDVARATTTCIFDKYKEQNLGRLCITRKGTVRVIQRTEEARIYAGIWLTDEEWEPIRRKPRKLLDLWEAKVKNSGLGKWIKSGIEATRIHNEAGQMINVIDLCGISGFQTELERTNEAFKSMGINLEDITNRKP